MSMQKSTLQRNKPIKTNTECLQKYQYSVSVKSFIDTFNDFCLVYNHLGKFEKSVVAQL